MHYPVQAQHSNCREAKGVHLLSIYKLEDGCGHVGESAEEIIKNQNIKNKLREKLHGSDSICGGKRRGNVLGQALIPTPLPPHMLPDPPTSSSSFCSRLQHLQSLMSQFHRNVARMTHIWLRGELGLSVFVTSGKKEAEWWPQMMYKIISGIDTLRNLSSVLMTGASATRGHRLNKSRSSLV